MSNGQFILTQRNRNLAPTSQAAIETSAVMFNASVTNRTDVLTKLIECSIDSRTSRGLLGNRGESRVKPLYKPGGGLNVLEHNDAVDFEIAFQAALGRPSRKTVGRKVGGGRLKRGGKYQRREIPTVREIETPEEVTGNGTFNFRINGVELATLYQDANSGKLKLVSSPDAPPTEIETVDEGLFYIQVDIPAAIKNMFGGASRITLLEIKSAVVTLDSGEEGSGLILTKYTMSAAQKAALSAIGPISLGFYEQINDSLAKIGFLDTSITLDKEFEVTIETDQDNFLEIPDQSTAISNIGQLVPLETAKALTGDDLTTIQNKIDTSLESVENRLDALEADVNRLLLNSGIKNTDLQLLGNTVMEDIEVSGETILAKTTINASTTAPLTLKPVVNYGNVRHIPLSGALAGGSNDSTVVTITLLDVSDAHSTYLIRGDLVFSSLVSSVYTSDTLTFTALVKGNASGVSYEVTDIDLNTNGNQVNADETPFQITGGNLIMRLLTAQSITYRYTANMVITTTSMGSV